MRMRTFAWIVSLLSLAAPAGLRAQEVIPRPFVGPLSHPRYEEGGFFTAVEFLFWAQKNPLKNQALAARGFYDLDGSIGGIPGGFVGSGEEALNTQRLRGPTTFTPGFNLTAGYRFNDGVTLQASWYHLSEARYTTSASILPANFRVGDFLENTFISSPVVNLPPAFAGNDRNTNLGAIGATTGIFNAASIMQLEFKQRFEMVDLIARVPITETGDFRTYGLFGPRAIILWERFKWRSVDMDPAGESNPSTSAVYTNVTSNRLYGLFLGSGNEFRLGDSRIGTLSAFCDIGVSAYADFVKGRAKYALEDDTFAIKRSRNTWAASYGLDAKVGVNWYIYEAIQLRLGYSLIGLVNTVASRRPVDFNAGTIDPGYDRNVFRHFHGIDAGVAFVW